MASSTLITGGKGMLGRALAAAMRLRGTEAISLDRATLDIADERALREVFDQHRPAVVFNAAAHTKVDLCEDEPEKADAINGRAVGSLARLAREYDAALVHFSTDFVFDGQSRRPYRIDDPTHPISAYGRSKLLGERLLEENAPARWMIVRTAWVYGWGGMNFPWIIVERARAGQPLKVVEDEIGSPTYAHDLAVAAIELLERGASGLWHVTNSGQVSRYDYAKAICAEFDLQADLTPISTAQWLQIRPKQARRPAYSVLDIEPAARQLGHPIRPWRAALHAFRKEVEQRGGFA